MPSNAEKPDLIAKDILLWRYSLTIAKQEDTREHNTMLSHELKLHVYLAPMSTEDADHHTAPLNSLPHLLQVVGGVAHRRSAAVSAATAHLVIADDTAIRDVQKCKFETREKWIWKRRKKWD